MSRRNLVIGGGKQGKSPFIASLAKALLAKPNNKMRVVVLSPSTPLAWNFIAEQTGDIVQLQRFLKHGKGILLFHWRNKDALMEALEAMQDSSDLMLVMEDATQVFYGRLPENVRDWLYQAKNRNVELFIITHSLTDTPAELRRAANRIILFFTSEDIEKNETRFFNLYPVGWFDKLKKYNKLLNDAHRDARGEWVARPKPEQYVQDHYIFETGL